MITPTELVQARETLLERAVSFFTAHPDVIGVFLSGSLPAGSADAYSDIDLRIIATPEGQVLTTDLAALDLVTTRQIA